MNPNYGIEAVLVDGVDLLSCCVASFVCPQLDNCKLTGLHVFIEHYNEWIFLFQIKLTK